MVIQGIIGVILVQVVSCKTLLRVPVLSIPREGSRRWLLWSKVWGVPVCVTESEATSSWTGTGVGVFESLLIDMAFVCVWTLEVFML